MTEVPLGQRHRLCGNNDVAAEFPAEVDKTIVDEATDVAFADGGPDRVRAVVIVHEGAIVYERYSPSLTDGPDVVMPSYSMAKSVGATLIGMLVRDGRIKLDQPAPVPEWNADPEDPRAAITVEQILHMSITERGRPARTEDRHVD